MVRRSASLHVPDPRPLADALIAATGLVRRLTAVTCNVTDFTATGVQVYKPLGGLSGTLMPGYGDL